MLTDDHRNGHAADHGLPLNTSRGKFIDPVQQVTFIFEQSTHVARCLSDTRYYDG
jgi:hypothetical protein